MKKRIAKLLRHWAYLLDKPVRKPKAKEDPTAPLWNGWPEEPR